MSFVIDFPPESLYFCNLFLEEQNVALRGHSVCVCGLACAHVHICMYVKGCKHVHCVYILCMVICSIVSYDMPFTVNSGEMPFQTALIHCPSRALDGFLMFCASSSGQFANSNHSSYKLLCCVVL